MPQTIGIDFGTTNSVVSVAMPDGQTRTAIFPWATGASETFRTILCFWEHQRHLHTACGQTAIDEYLKDTEGSRFIQSIKTYLGSPLFTETRLFGRRFELEDLIALFLKDLWARAATSLTLDPDPSKYSVTSGRPVKFAGADPDELLATTRLIESYARAGFGPVTLAYEPEGAAFWFAQRTIKPSYVLVADFGGGTSDFSIVHIANQTVSPIAHSGIGIAGDNFDYRLIDQIVAPKLGKGSTYQSYGKTMDMPISVYRTFASWHLLSLLKTPKTIREIQDVLRTSSDPKALEMLLHIIHNELGFLLYRSISTTKSALSQHDRADFVFEANGVLLKSTVRRSDFEKWISEDIEKIRTCIQDLLTKTKLKPSDIDHVFMTGGTSFVPAIQKMMGSIFGPEKLASGDEFTSVSAGLAMIGQTVEKRSI